ncbi:MAG: hypothetical protein DRH20_06015 [Deltaproteobacteria bacterium]|nr:MAG: hypothetical protein DRH20_06015 [Deltaproteobacteria bacterium]
MRVSAAGRSHVGKKRKVNEDEILIAPDLGLYVLADGMGGHKAGEVASRMAVHTMKSYWEGLKKGVRHSWLGPYDEDLEETANHLINAIAYTNAAIHEAQKRPAYHRMGSTISAAVVGEDMIWAANVGDSRIYLYDQERLRQVSTDHSLAGEQRSLGFGDTSGKGLSPLKNLLTRVLGPEEEVRVDLWTLRPNAGDLLMLCSDGLTNYAEERAIEAVLDDFSLSLERRVTLLIEEALRGGGGDNVSVILLEVQEEGRWDKFKRRFRPRSMA